MAYDEQAFEEAMDDVHTRFILNLPDEELSSSDRIFFQLEQAWWFYDDFICDANTDTAKKLPRFKHMKPFSLAIIKTHATKFRQDVRGVFKL
jgi:mRNA-decapping enzyme subunit 2